MQKTGKSALALLVIDLAEAQDKLRKVQREIGRMNNKTQIGFLMKSREELIANVESKRALLERKIERTNALSIEIFEVIYRVLSVYGRSVVESVIFTFERESGKQPLEIMENVEAFRKCLQKVFGRSSSKKIESTVIFEICNEFGMLVSSKTTLSDAIRIARLNNSRLRPGQDVFRAKGKS